MLYICRRRTCFLEKETFFPINTYKVDGMHMFYMSEKTVSVTPSFLLYRTVPHKGGVSKTTRTCTEMPNYSYGHDWTMLRCDAPGFLGFRLSLG
jgi:hypothetical protein